jgi:hypothetical protein
VLLPLLTSLLLVLPTFSNPGATSQSLQFENDRAMRVELVFAEGTGGVPLPIRLHGIDTDRNVVVCDTSACLQPRIVHVPARTIVDVEAPTNESGVPILGVMENGSVANRCCERNTSAVIAAVVTDTIAPASLPGERNGDVVSVTPVGRLFDEHPALMATVPMMVLVDGDMSHDDAFFAALRQFVVDGGVLSLDAPQAARLGATPTTFQPSRSAPERTVADAVGTLFVPSTHMLAGAVHAIDGAGFVVVRPAHQPLREAVADIAFVEGAAHGWTRGGLWLSDGDVVHAVLTGLQPPLGTGTALAWLLAFGVVASAAASLVWRRRQLNSPVHAALVVFGLAVGSAVVATTVATLTATTRRTELVVHGPGAKAHTRTTVRAAVNDVDTPTASIAFADAPAAFIFARGRSTRTGADVAAVGIWHDIDQSNGWLEQRWDGVQYTHTNHFSHDVTLVGSGIARTLPAKATVTDWMSSDNGLKTTEPSQQAMNVAWALASRFDATMAVYVDNAGISHVVVGTAR